VEARASSEGEAEVGVESDADGDASPASEVVIAMRH
jgi:hypothetical protein